MTMLKGRFDLERSLACPPDRLWVLLTDAKMREIWGAPSDDMVLIVDQTDLREGGRDRHRCGPKETPEFEIETVWYKLMAPDAACFSESVIVGEERISTSLVTYSVTTEGSGSKLSVDVTVASFTGEDMTQDHLDGWTSGLNRLVTLAAQPQS